MTTLQVHLPQILLIYSLSFFVLAAVVYLHPREEKVLVFAPDLWLLGAFGLLHGLREGTEWWLVSSASVAMDNAFTAALLFVSYLALLEFARRLWRHLDPARWSGWHSRSPALWLAVLALLGPPLFAVWTGGGIPAWVAGIRYGIGLPGALLTGLGLWRFARRETASLAPLRLMSWFGALALGFMLYGVFAGLVVRGFPQLPPVLPTTTAFLAATGVPVYLVRAACALLMAASVAEILRRLHRAARHQEQSLAHSLEQVNATLESRVASRTAALEQANQQLRASEARYRGMVNSTQEGVWQIDAESRTVFVNQRMADMLGYSVEEMLGESLFRFMDDAGRAIAEHNVERRRQGVAEEHEFTFLRKDGSPLLAWLNTFPAFDEAGCYVGGTALISDLSARRAAEEALRRNELRYLSVISSLAEGIVIQSTSDKIFDCNPAAEKILGLTRDQLLGRTSMDPNWQALHEDGTPFRGEDHPSMVTLHSGEPQRDVIMNIHRPDGSRVWIEVNSEPIRDPESQAVIGVVASFADITQRKQAQMALVASEYKWHAVFDQTYQFIGLMDAQGILREANRTALNFLGIAEADVLGKHFADTPWWTHDPLQQARLREAIERARRGELVRFETTHIDQAGALHYVDFSIKPVLNDQGELLWLVPEGRDITDRHRDEESLLEIARGVSAQTGLRFFESLVQHLASVLQADFAFIGELIPGTQNQIRTLAVYASGSFVTNFAYDLMGTPCENVVGRDTCAYPCDVQTQFPTDQMLVDMGVQAYVGTPLFTANGEALGLMSVLYRAPLERAERATTTLQIFAARAGAEVERRQREVRMRQLSGAIEQTADSVVIANRAGIVEYVNRAFEEMTGYTQSEAIGRTLALIKSGAHDRAYYHRMWDILVSGDVFRDVVINRRKAGDVYYEEKTITPLRDESGEITHFISTGKDVTERMRTQSRLEYMAQHDTLTNLPNRALFIDRLGQALTGAQRRQRAVAVLFLDLDRFKYINDTFGHDVGDRFLQQFASRLIDSLREGDTVARFGGDEFAVLLEDVANAESVSPIAEKLLAVLATPFVVDSHEFYVTTSVGISLFPADGKDASTLLKHADAAMYRAKDLGRNNFQYYSADLSARAFERLTVETRLRQALERSEFFLHFQPQIDLGSRRVVGVESLIRWNDATLGAVSPAQFIPVAEDTGLIVPIGEWVLRTACIQARKWVDLGLDFGHVTVNISGRQFADPKLAQRIGAILQETGLAPERLELEITEGVVMHDAQFAVHALNELNDSGVRIAVDDFGTGYSSLAYLRRYPIDTLKIDQSFVRDITDDPNDASIVQAVIAMGHGMGLKVVAEGVETEAQCSFLHQHRCDAVQGYLFSRPVAALALEDAIRQGFPGAAPSACCQSDIAGSTAS